MSEYDIPNVLILFNIVFQCQNDYANIKFKSSFYEYENYKII